MKNVNRMLVIAVASASIGAVVVLLVRMQIDASIAASLYPSGEEPIHSVEEFGPLKVGLTSPYRPGDWALAPYYTIPHSQFYVFALQRELGVGCIHEDCGMSGVFVQCLGGWLSGSGATQAEYADPFGMDFTKVQTEGISMIIVADRHSNIVGIYPDSTTHNIPRILKYHTDLYYSKAWDWCTEYHMPR